MNLSVCYILKNEEKTIKQSLESIKKIAGQIVIVDTGCTDKTIEICKEYSTNGGCDIFKYESYTLPFTKGELEGFNQGELETFNFSDARNYGISKCEGDYILILDGDEYFFDHDELKKVISENTDADIFEFIQVNYRTSATGGSLTKQFRLFKNFIGIKYEGIVHETLVTQDSSCRKYEILRTELTIIHEGKQLNETDFEIKMQSIIDSVTLDNNAKKKYYLGIYYLRTGNHVQALRFLNECIF